MNLSAVVQLILYINDDQYGVLFLVSNTAKTYVVIISCTHLQTTCPF